MFGHFSGLLFSGQLAPSFGRTSNDQTISKVPKRKVVTYVAIGDSLTKGVGDSTNQGGFVPLLAQSLTNESGLEFKAINYGVSGNTSGQILSRMQEKRRFERT